MPPSDGDRADETYRAIGRYMVQFSHLIRHMRELMVLRAITREKIGNDPNVADIALAGAAPMDIMRSFFGMCRYISDLDNDERKVEEVIRGRVRRVIEERNDIAHGDWYVGREEGADSLVQRLHAFRKDGHGELIVYWPEMLDELSDDIQALTILVREFGSVALSEPYPPWVKPSGSPGIRDLRVKDVWSTRTTKHKQPDGTFQKTTTLHRDGPHGDVVIQLAPVEHSTRAMRLKRSPAHDVYGQESEDARS